MRVRNNPTRICLLALASMGVAAPAGAYEYALQYTPNAGARGLVVAGYSLVKKTVIGNCSYYTQHSGSGRGGGYKTYITHYDQTCTWDLYGNLLSVKPGAPAAPTPVSTNGTETVYAVKTGGGYTGTDSALPLGGFVFTKGPHYSWTTSNAYMVLQQTPYTFTATLVSDGDSNLRVTAVDATTPLGRTAVSNTTCTGVIKKGKTCDVTVTYDATRLTSPSGLAYDTLTIALTTNSKQAYDFVQHYTVVVPVPVDDGG